MGPRFIYAPAATMRQPTRWPVGRSLFGQAKEGAWDPV